MKSFFAYIIVLMLVCFGFANAQTTEVRNYLKMVAQGKVDEVKKVIPDMLAEYPDDPGVQLLFGVVIDDANRAVDIYEKIIKKYPDSEFADECYWRIIQFYAVKGDMAKAQSNLAAYRAKFPSSEFLSAATDVVRIATSISKPDGKSLMMNKGKANTDETTTTKTPDKKTKDKIDKPDKKPTSEKTIIGDKETTKESGKETYGLQVGIYSNQDAAKSEVERFRAQRLQADIMTKQVDGETMYAVVIGNYSSKEVAEAAKNLVQQQCNCSPIIFKK